MPDSDLDALFGEVADELGSEEDSDVSVDDTDDVQVDDPSDVESTDVDDGDNDIDDDVDVDHDDDDTPSEDDGTDDDDSWNWEDYADQLVPRTVNGETEMVPLREAIQGSMRQADYTQKTQKLAEAEKAAKWAQDVQAAFERDPEGTLEAFARAYGLIDDQGQPVGQQNQRQNLEDLDEDIRPWAEAATRAEQQLAQMEQRLVQMENDRIKNEIRSELDMLAGRFGESFDKAEVLQAAAQKNLTLEDAYWYLQGQRTFQQNQQQSEADSAAKQAADKAKADSEAKRRKAKKAAAGSSTRSFKASDIPADDFDDIGDLYEQITASGGS